MLYYADRISQNIRKREPEGYLICVNVPIARTGTQEYLQDEIGQEGDGMVTLYRPEEEVFSEATIASFEGMPVTDDHPDTDEGVTAENSQYLAKGHVQNVHRGTGDERNMLIADLFINDPTLIEKVLDGKREISCGYNYELSEEDGKLVQRQIRGNHVAVVDKGRAGKRVCIKDSAPHFERRKKKMANKKNHVWILSKMLGRFAKDATPEELEAAVDAIDDITNADTPTDPIPGTATKPEDVVKDEAPEDKLDAILTKLDALLNKGATDEDPEKDPLEQLEDDLDALEVKEEETPAEEPEEEPYAPDEDPDEAESHFVDPAEINEQDEDMPIPEEETVDCKARDAARAAIKAIKPIIAKLPEKERKAAADAAVAAIRKNSGLAKRPVKNDYISLKRAKARKASDKSAATADLANRIMAKRNVNFKKG